MRVIAKPGGLAPLLAWRRIFGSLVSIGAVFTAGVSEPARANDIQPRLFTNVPVGMNFVGVSLGHSEGNIALDPNLAVEDLTAKIDTMGLSYARSLGLWGKSSLVSVAVPYAGVSLRATVDGEPASLDRSAMLDPSFVVAVNLSGAPAMSMEEFAGYRQKTIVGLNFKVTAPLGNYDPERVLNFGANRWSLSPELGISRRAGRFTFEAAGSVTWFSDNDEYLIDSTLEQDEILVLRANVLYHFNKPGMWLGAGVMYWWGGGSFVDGQDRNDLQKTSRVGVALSVPLAPRHNLLFKVTEGVTARIGADFVNFTLAYSYRF